ncbi:MAG TPA: hypothetical protein VLT62_08960 [Candidatus Methylomirabilis sp.]|nr:hypothetical protein [Candidatus Methylomirabilis sp.]
MLQEMDLWSPERELRLLEELAEAEAKAFDVDLGLPVPTAAADSERAWVAYWHLPPNGIPPKARSNQRPTSGR